MSIEHFEQDVDDEIDLPDSKNTEIRSPLINNDANESDAYQVDTQQSESHQSEGAIMFFIKDLLSIYADQSGSCIVVSKGISVILAIGVMVGAIVPKDPDLPTPWYRFVSSSIGYIYFFSWSVSFYPQIITNYQKKVTDGVSTDAYILAALNYTCYTLYNVVFYFDGGIRQEYKDRYGPDAIITVQSNDVAFSIHALVVTFLVVGQITYYGGFRNQPISSITKLIVLAVFLLSFVYIACIYLYGYLWMDFLYLMASVKLVLTILTYLPQIILNYQRRSTDGWNVWNVIFDCMGGLFSMFQLILDSVDLGDVKGGLVGNWAKLLLGALTIGFDAIFLLQHYFYKFNMDDEHSVEGEDETYTLLENEVPLECGVAAPTEGAEHVRVF